MKENKRKCFKCGSSPCDDPETTLFRFPKPGSTNILRCELWANYCCPDKSWANKDFQLKLYTEHRMLCHRHFNEAAFVDLPSKKLRRFASPDVEADQVQSQAQDAGDLGSGEGSTTAPPTNQFSPEPVSAEQDNVIEPPSAQPDIKPEEPMVQQEVEESKPAELSATTTPANSEVIQNDVKDNGDWQQRELELLKKIEQLEKIKNERSEDGVKLELKVREEEIDLLKARVRNLETELQAALSKPSGKNHEMIENIKQQHEELLSKARGMIFDKTKMVKNQELQIEALTTQVQSLKDINVITKDLLEIRNSEVKAMEDRLLAMEARFKAEKDRYGLVLQRAQTSTTLNDDLKKEYETQLAIFKELRVKYEQRVQALVSENTKLKEIAALKAGGTSA